MDDNVPAVKKGRNSTIVQAGLVRFAELQKDSDRLAREVVELQSQVTAMTATMASSQQQLSEAREEAARYMRSYTELLTSLNNAVMVLNTAEENARMTAELPSARLVPGQDPSAGAGESPRRVALRVNARREKEKAGD